MPISCSGFYLAIWRTEIHRAQNAESAGIKTKLFLKSHISRLARRHVPGKAGNAKPGGRGGSHIPVCSTPRAGESGKCEGRAPHIPVCQTPRAGEAGICGAGRVGRFARPGLPDATGMGRRESGYCDAEFASWHAENAMALDAFDEEPLVLALTQTLAARADALGQDIATRLR